MSGRSILTIFAAPFLALAAYVTVTTNPGLLPQVVTVLGFLAVLAIFPHDRNLLIGAVVVTLLIVAAATQGVASQTEVFAALLIAAAVIAVIKTAAGQDLQQSVKGLIPSRKRQEEAAE